MEGWVGLQAWAWSCDSCSTPPPPGSLFLKVLHTPRTHSELGPHCLQGERGPQHLAGGGRSGQASKYFLLTAVRTRVRSGRLALHTDRPPHQENSRPSFTKPSFTDEETEVQGSPLSDFPKVPSSWQVASQDLEGSTNWCDGEPEATWSHCPGTGAAGTLFSRIAGGVPRAWVDLWIPAVGTYLF